MKWRNITQAFIFVSIFLFHFFRPTWSLTILTSFFRLSSLKQNFSSLTHPQAVSSRDHSCQEQELEFYMSVWIGNPNLLQDSPLADCISGLPFEGAVAVQMLSGRCELSARCGWPGSHMAAVNVAPSPG